MIYLASPYSHEDEKVREKRYDLAVAMTGLLMKAGFAVFSPIVHCHVVAQRMGLPTNWEFWEKYDTEMLMCSDMLLILEIDGWDTSSGIAHERKISDTFGIPEIGVTFENVNVFIKMYENEDV